MSARPILVSLWAHSLSVATLVAVGDGCRRLGCSKGFHITNMSLI